jgi:hypothetical protein
MGVSRSFQNARVKLNRARRTGITRALLGCQDFTEFAKVADTMYHDSRVPSKMFYKRAAETFATKLTSQSCSLCHSFPQCSFRDVDPILMQSDLFRPEMMSLPFQMMETSIHMAPEPIPTRSRDNAKVTRELLTPLRGNQYLLMISRNSMMYQSMTPNAKKP